MGGGGIGLLITDRTKVYLRLPFSYILKKKN